MLLALLGFNNFTYTAYFFTLLAKNATVPSWWHLGMD